MEPAEKQLTMAELAALFKQAQSVRRGAASAPVVYLQKQNDNLRTELPLLLPDNLHLPWVEEVRCSLPRPRHGVVLPPQALPCVRVCRRWAPSRTPSTSGSATRARSARCTRCRPLAHSPDAAVRAMTHARRMAWQDPYENVYAVVSGTKTFVLFPPFDLPHLHEERFVKGHYTYQGPLPSPMLHPPCCGAGRARRVVVVAAASLDSSPDAHERRREQMACLASRSTSPRRASHGSPVRGGSSREPLRCASTAAQADSTRCLQWILSGRTTLGTRTFTRCVCARVYMGGTSNVSLLVPQAKPFYVEVHAGDILYLPSLWYHQVGQIGDDEGKTVAIVRHSRAARLLAAGCWLLTSDIPRAHRAEPVVRHAVRLQVELLLLLAQPAADLRAHAAAPARA